MDYAEISNLKKSMGKADTPNIGRWIMLRPLIKQSMGKAETPNISLWIVLRPLIKNIYGLS